MSFFKNYLVEMGRYIADVDTDLLEKAAGRIGQLKGSGRKLIIVGNGGSAAIASHVSVDMTKTVGLRAVNFNEADLLTCFANDYGYEHWVERALDCYADKGDIVVLISSSGESRNIVQGAVKAKNMGLGLITFSGFSEQNALRKMGDINFWVNSRSYNVVEMAHHVWLLAIVDQLAEVK